MGQCDVPRVEREDHCDEHSRSAEPAEKNDCTHPGSQKAGSTPIGVLVNNHPPFRPILARKAGNWPTLRSVRHLHREPAELPRTENLVLVWGRRFRVTGTAANLPSHTRTGSSRSTFSFERVVGPSPSTCFLSLAMPRKWKLGPLWMEADVFDYATECPVCLRWFVPIHTGENDGCWCEGRRGVPRYPNRVRSSALRRGLSLRELQRRTALAWSGVIEISNGRRAPHRSTQLRILRALGLPSSEAKRVFPRPRGPNRRKPVAG